MPKKRGRPPYEPTASQRRRVARAIAAGLTLEQIAAVLAVPLGTMRRAFDSEIKLGRVRAILENVDRLHKAADRGSVAAMKELARMMQPAPDETENDDDPWTDVTDGQAILSRNAGFH